MPSTGHLKNVLTWKYSSDNWEILCSFSSLVLDDIIIFPFSCGLLRENAGPSDLLLCMILDGSSHTQYNYIGAYHHSPKQAFISRVLYFCQVFLSQRFEIPGVPLGSSFILYLPFSVHFLSVTKSWLFSSLTCLFLMNLITSTVISVVAF